MTRGEALIIACSLTLLVIMAYIAGNGDGKRLMRKEAIQRGYAEYNPTNGVWQWKEQAK